MDTATLLEAKEPIILVEWFNDHYYKVAVGETVRFIPSVTTKLGIVDKPALARWRGDIGNREADLRMYDAQQKGKRIHWAWETALKGGCVVYDPWQNPIYTEEGISELKEKYKGLVAVLRTQEEMWAVDKIRRQFEILKPQVLGVEEKVYDLDTNDAGTIDAIYWVEAGEYLINGSKAIVFEQSGVIINDLKTGGDVYDEAWYQTAKYMAMWEKKHQVLCLGTMVTHTSAKTKKGVPGLASYFHSRQEVMDHDLPMFHKIAAVWDAKHEGEEPEQFQFPSLITLGGINELRGSGNQADE